MSDLDATGTVQYATRDMGGMAEMPEGAPSARFRQFAEELARRGMRPGERRFTLRACRQSPDLKDL